MAGFRRCLRGFWAPIRGDLQVYDPIGGRLAYARPSLDCVDASYIWLYAVFTGMRTLLRSFMSMYNYSYYSTSFLSNSYFYMRPLHFTTNFLLFKTRENARNTLL